LPMQLYSSFSPICTSPPQELLLSLYSPLVYALWLWAQAQPLRRYFLRLIHIDFFFFFGVVVFVAFHCLSLCVFFPAPPPQSDPHNPPPPLSPSSTQFFFFFHLLPYSWPLCVLLECFLMVFFVLSFFLWLCVVVRRLLALWCVVVLVFVRRAHSCQKRTLQ